MPTSQVALVLGAGLYPREVPDAEVRPERERVADRAPSREIA
ncbi:hypothetical protein [Nonomuraea aurantiaca]|nr:hypothetical protein [Nonomuraea aurantiaca]